MLDSELESRLRDAQRAQADEAEPGALLERVLAIPDEVEPRRQRRLFGLSRRPVREPGRGPGLDATGRKGGRTMFSPLRLATATAAAVLAVYVGVLGPGWSPGPGPAAAPGASAAPEGDTHIIVTGSGSSRCSGAGFCIGTWDFSDPRLSGDLRVEFSADCEAEAADCLLWGSVTVTNEGGSWSGDVIGFRDDPGDHRMTSWMTGSGDYEGWYFVGSGARSDVGAEEWRAILAQGVLPTVVTLGLPAATESPAP